MIKDINILKAREWGRQELERPDQDKEVESVMIVATPPKGVRRVDKCGRWTSAKNGSRPHTRPLVNK